MYGTVEHAEKQNSTAPHGTPPFSAPSPVVRPIVVSRIMTAALVAAFVVVAPVAMSIAVSVVVIIPPPRAPAARSLASGRPVRLTLAGLPSHLLPVEHHSVAIFLPGIIRPILAFLFQARYAAKASSLAGTLSVGGIPPAL